MGCRLLDLARDLDLLLWPHWVLQDLDRQDLDPWDPDLELELDPDPTPPPSTQTSACTTPNSTAPSLFSHRLTVSWRHGTWWQPQPERRHRRRLSSTASPAPSTPLPTTTPLPSPTPWPPTSTWPCFTRRAPPKTRRH